MNYIVSNDEDEAHSIIDQYNIVELTTLIGYCAYDISEIKIELANINGNMRLSAARRFDTFQQLNYKTALLCYCVDRLAKYFGVYNLLLNTVDNVLKNGVV